MVAKASVFRVEVASRERNSRGNHDALEALLKEKSVKLGDTATWLTEYNELQTKDAQAFLQSRQKTVKTLKDDIVKTGFTLVLANLLARWDDPQQPSEFCSRVRQFRPHPSGVLITAGLLTLGAPSGSTCLKM